MIMLRYLILLIFEIPMSKCSPKEICRSKEYCLVPGARSCKSCPPDTICCPSTGLSRKKCEEYGAYVYTSDFSAALSSRRTLTQNSECSIAAVGLVVGGVDAKPKEFPHMVCSKFLRLNILSPVTEDSTWFSEVQVGGKINNQIVKVAIGFGDNPQRASWKCGGSLISEQYVLTAAHCETDELGDEAQFAKLGTIDLSEDDSEVQILKIAEKIIHPMYLPPSNYHDLAIFKLEKPANIDGYCRPACLHEAKDKLLTSSTAIATGWGKIEYHRSTGHNILQKVELKVVDEEVCNKSYRGLIGSRSMNDGVQPSMICAGIMEGGKDTCQGDSGGPLQIVLQEPYCMYSIVGITSFGSKGCGLKNSPAVYTKVAHYIPWIESVIWSSELR